MFPNNISIYTLPIIGVLFAILSITYSKTIHLFSYQLSRKSSSKNIHSNDSRVSIQVNPVDEQTTLLTLNDDDDDDDLIKSDVLSTNFGDNDSIELRLDQDIDD